MRTRLNVPDADIATAKKLGAQYDENKHEFFIENVDDMFTFLRWIDKRLTRPCGPVICSKD